jgi:hypothetical protein
LVRDVSGLAPLVTLEMFTWDYAGADQNNREMDVSIWRPSSERVNRAKFILQPYQVSTNSYEFDLRPGAYSHSFRWEAGRIEFVTSIAGSRNGTVARHSFTLGVPTPGLESTRIALFLNKTPQLAEAEVVVDRFEYTP